MTSNNTAAPKFTSYQVLAILLLGLTQFTVVLDFMVMSPLGDLLMKSMDLKPTQFGFAVSAYAFSAGFSGLMTAGFADRFGRKKLLLFFYVGFIGGTLLCGLANSYFTLLAARIVTGLFGGVIGAISMAIIADLFPLNQRGRAMGFIQMGFGASQVLGIPISLFIANEWGWQSPFYMIVGLAALIWFVLIMKLQPVNEHLKLKSEKTAFLHLWHTIKLRKYRIGFLTTALLSLGGFMLAPWGSAYAINNMKVTEAQLPILFMIGGVVGLIVMPLVGKLSDRIDKFRIFTFASLWMIVTVVIYANLPPVHFMIVVAMNILMTIGILSRIVPSMALVTSLPQMQDRGAFMSINSSLQQIAGGIAAGISGLIVVQKTPFSPLEHFNTLSYVITVFLLVNIWMVWRVSNIVNKPPVAASQAN